MDSCIIDWCCKVTGVIPVTLAASITVGVYIEVDRYMKYCFFPSAIGFLNQMWLALLEAVSIEISVL